MFLLTIIIATANFALGYALAVWLGWASMPDFGKRPVAAVGETPPAGH